jgi:hypothetical protein
MDSVCVLIRRGGGGGGGGGERESREFLFGRSEKGDEILGGDGKNFLLRSVRLFCITPSDL